MKTQFEANRQVNFLPQYGQLGGYDASTLRQIYAAQLAGMGLQGQWSPPAVPAPMSFLEQIEAGDKLRARLSRPLSPEAIRTYRRARTWKRILRVINWLAHV
ncbi:MAG TPA: hypothetical protein VNH18_06495 [Bryobacteraceae bacterium]|nr:hypothetical protein [Bryobacteraceae bacterium]